MSAIIKFRIVIDHETDVFRDIELSANSTFLDLHNAIQAEFQFDNSQMASFYESDEMWDRGDEIALMDMSLEGSKDTIRLMESTPLHEVIEEENQKLLYVFDFFLMWIFYIEVVGFRKGELDSTYVVTHTYGTPPNQHDKKSDFVMPSDEDLLNEFSGSGGPKNTDDDEDDFYSDDQFNDYDFNDSDSNYY